MSAEAPPMLDLPAVSTLDGPRVSRWLGFPLLMLVTLIWGTTFVVIHVLENDPAGGLSPGVLTFGRFAIATILFLPWLRFDRKLWLVGLELGAWLAAGYATQAVGLTYTTVNRSAFITTLHVIVVPALTAWFGRRIWGGVWAAAGMALVGTALLSYDGSSPNRGDLWTVVTAVTYAVYIFRLEKFADRFPARALTFVQLATVSLLCGGWVLVERSPVHAVSAHSLAGLLYLGVIATAITTWLQAIGQRTVPGWQASMLYTLEPVFASIFAFAWRGDLLGVRGLIGATILLLAALLSQWPARGARVVVADGD